VAEVVDTLPDNVAAANDPVVGILFTLVIVALGAVTLGVAGLSFVQWRDGIEEKKAQEDAKAALRRGGKPEEDDDIDFTRPGAAKKKKAIKRATSKGFGAP